MKNSIFLIVCISMLSSCYDDENYIPAYYGYSGYTKCIKKELYNSNDSLINTIIINDTIPGDGTYARIHYYELQSLFKIKYGFDTCSIIPDFYIVNYTDTPYTIKFPISSFEYKLWILDTIPFKPEFYNISCN